MSSCLTRMLLVTASVVMMPSVVFGQGAIGGLVRDTSGAVLPGVTVEAASAALIEKTRTVVTDAGGHYLIVNLRPGTYTVTFTLPGFSTVKREGLVLSAAITLPVNVDLAVGAVQETVTVTGETPVVDIQNTRQQTVVSRNLLDSIPRVRNQGFTGSLLPGVTATGAAAAPGSFPMTTLMIHGSSADDQVYATDGFKFSEGSFGSRRMMVPSDLMAREYTFEISAISAEVATGSVRSNIIPKEGGNFFSGSLFGSYTSSGMVANNLTSDLIARGLTAVPEIDKSYDLSGAFGGPIMRDRAWFFGSGRHYGTTSLIPGAFSDANLTAPFFDKPTYSDYNGRLTWQLTPRHKVSTFLETGDWNTPHIAGLSPLTSAEASTNFQSPHIWLSQTRWTAPLTNRFLFEAGAQYFYQVQCNCAAPESLPGAYSIFDISSGKTTGYRSDFHLEDTYAGWLTTTGSVSYVTGSHAFKTGFSHLSGHWHKYTSSPDNYDRPLLILNNNVPFQVVLFPRPTADLPSVNHDLGIYAQDQWQLRNRVTLNLGLRFDYLNEQVDAVSVGAGNFVPARSFPQISNVPSWKDISPRVGMAWDVFGTGKTAVKVSLSRYLNADQGNFADLVSPQNPAVTSGVTDTRLWTDNGDRIPQLNELGPSTNRLFGTPVLNTTADPSITTGWGVRGYNWEFAASVQRELLPGLAASVGVYRRWFGDLIWKDNRAVQRSDYTPFTFTSPLNGEVITSYNLNPVLRGVTNNVLEFAPNDRRVYTGVEFTVNGKFGRGGVVNGGATLGRTSLRRCTASDPNVLRFCDVTPPLMASSSYKAIVSYPLPYDVLVSSVFISQPYLNGNGGLNPYNNGGADQSFTPLLAANYSVTSAIAGLPLTNGSINVNLATPGSVIGDRQNKLDFRVAKAWRVGSTKLQPYADLYNALNSSPALSINEVYGSKWLLPSKIFPGRVLQLGMQIDFR